MEIYGITKLAFMPLLPFLCVCENLEWGSFNPSCLTGSAIACGMNYRVLSVKKRCLTMIRTFASVYSTGQAHLIRTLLIRSST